MYDSNKITNKSGQNQSQPKNSMKDKNNTNSTPRLSYQNKNNSSGIKNFTEFLDRYRDSR